MHDRQDLKQGTQEEYRQLYGRFVHPDPMFLAVYSGYTRMDGDEFGPGCRTETVWGFRDRDVAVMGIVWAGETFETRTVESYWVNDVVLRSLRQEHWYPCGFGIIAEGFWPDDWSYDYWLWVSKTKGYALQRSCTLSSWWDYKETI